MRRPRHRILLLALTSAELKTFVRALTIEEQRAVADSLTDEELALFDILTKPEPKLTKTEEADVKRVCRELLES